MNRNQFNIMKQYQSIHWWYLGRKKLIQYVLFKNKISLKNKSIADIGCGFCSNLDIYKNYLKSTALLDADDEVISHLKKNFKVKEIIKWVAPEKINRKFDFVLLTDVIEHIDDDLAAINSISESLQDDGHILITVPAYNFFWSSMDDEVHHKRRYGEYTIKKLLGPEYKFIYFSHYNFFLSPLKFLVIFYERLCKFFKYNNNIDHNRLPNSLLNKLFIKISYLEVRLLSFVKKYPFGVGIVLLAQKKSK